MFYSAIVAVFPLQALCVSFDSKDVLSPVTATLMTLLLWMLKMCTSMLEVVLSRRFRSWLC